VEIITILQEIVAVIVIATAIVTATVINLVTVIATAIQPTMLAAEIRMSAILLIPLVADKMTDL
jgi:hypothetical protein